MAFGRQRAGGQRGILRPAAGRPAAEKPCPDLAVLSLCPKKLPLPTAERI
ncbi:MAG: hypothetical protein ACK4Q5_12050 [Saprospiraceae bacterium]